MVCAVPRKGGSLSAVPSSASSDSAGGDADVEAASAGASTITASSSNSNSRNDGSVNHRHVPQVICMLLPYIVNILKKLIVPCVSAHHATHPGDTDKLPPDRAVLGGQARFGPDVRVTAWQMPQLICVCAIVVCLNLKSVLSTISR